MRSYDQVNTGDAEAKQDLSPKLPGAQLDLGNKPQKNDRATATRTNLGQGIVNNGPFEQWWHKQVGAKCDNSILDQHAPICFR
jgi:hypothetical protein